MLDPNIPLSVQPFKLKPLGQSLDEASQARSRAQQQEMNALRIQQERDQMASQQRATEGQAAFQQTLSSGGSRAKILESLQGQPELYEKAVKHFDLVDTSFKRYMGDVAAGVRAFGDSPDAAMAALDDLIAQGFDEKRLEQYRGAIQENPGSVAQLIDSMLASSPDEAHRAMVKKAKEPEAYTLGPGQVRFGADNKPLAQVDKPVEAPTVGSFEDYVTRYAAASGKKPNELAPADIEDARKRYQQADDRPRITVQTGGGRQGLTPNMESQVITKLARDWTAATKPARELDRQVSIMREGIKASRSGNLAAGGQAVLVTFQKILDPNSVVRESEFDRSREGLSLMQRARAAMERMASGGPGVPLAELERYAALAEQIARAQRDSRLKAIQERLGRMADRYSIPRDLVFEGSAEAEAPPPPAGGGNPAMPSYQDYLNSRRKPGGGQ